MASHIWLGGRNGLMHLHMEKLRQKRDAYSYCCGVPVKCSEVGVFIPEESTSRASRALIHNKKSHEWRPPSRWPQWLWASQNLWSVSSCFYTKVSSSTCLPISEGCCESESGRHMWIYFPKSKSHTVIINPCYATEVHPLSLSPYLENENTVSQGPELKNWLLIIYSFIP